MTAKKDNISQNISVWRLNASPVALALELEAAVPEALLSVEPPLLADVTPSVAPVAPPVVVVGLVLPVVDAGASLGRVLELTVPHSDSTIELCADS
jgi:hypothetical protein